MKGAVPQPEEQFREMGRKNVETLLHYKEQGKVLAGGAIAGKKGSYAIFNVDSVEELQVLVIRLSLYQFMEIEVIPLISWEQTLNYIKQI
jgi:muconolactone delta-isomerase